MLAVVYASVSGGVGQCLADLFSVSDGEHVCRMVRIRQLGRRRICRASSVREHDRLFRGPSHNVNELFGWRTCILGTDFLERGGPPVNVALHICCDQLVFRLKLAV